MKKKQSINCSVSNCNHNDEESNKCILEEIEVKSDCNNASEKKETICDSFKCDCGCKEDNPNEKEE